MMPALQCVDHLVYATPDLDSTIAEVEQRFGVRALPGGRHLDRGTRNALIALGPQSYLELIGPDLASPAMKTPRWFGIDDLAGPRLVAWAAKAVGLEGLVADAAKQGVALGSITSGSRLRPDGIPLSWRLTTPPQAAEDGVIPFFIDWGSSPHPATFAAGGAELTAFHAEHPNPPRLQAALLALGIPLKVVHGLKPALVATIRTAAGKVQLR